MITNLLTALKSILPLFQAGGRFGSWRLWIIAASTFVSSMQGHDILFGLGVPDGLLMWVAAHLLALVNLLVAITMIKDHLKAAATAPSAI